jgi:transaldolase
MSNPLIELTNLGQSIWYDNIERKLFLSGDFQRMIDEDGLRGMTSNPAIFEKAISSSEDYNEQLKELAAAGKSAMDIYEALAIRDIQTAADILKPVYEKTGKLDGYVSLECSPLLATDTQGTIEEARRLWQTVNRPNVMIKIPGTLEGIPAIEQCLYEGININITLLFSLKAYQATIDAYINGLTRRLNEGKTVDGIASVASFFVSRIDSAVDKKLAAKIEQAGSEEEKAKLKSIEGRVAIANAKMAYQIYKENFHSDRFAALKAAGAMVQRALWASTSTKNPAYSDVYYVEALMGNETVNTIPAATYKAFKDHGKPRISIEDHLNDERAVLANLDEVGINLDEVTQQVLDEGVTLFIQPFEKLLASIKAKRDELARGQGAASD